MKRISLCFLIVIIFSTGFLSAQSLKFGIKGGADIHKVTGKSFSEQFTFGYHIGGFAEIGVTSRFGIQPEILFTQVNVDTGTRFRDITPEFNSITEIKLSYLNIPILLNYKLNNFVAFQAGPQFGILIDQNSNLLTNGREAFKKGDFSMLGGLQISISKIRLYGRYAVGLSNINDVNNREKWKNQSVQLGLGITL